MLPLFAAFSALASGIASKIGTRFAKPGYTLRTSAKKWIPTGIPNAPRVNQRQVRKNRRRAHAAGDKKAFR